MIEILDPTRDAARIALLLEPGSGYRLVDAWPIAVREWRAIAPTAPLPEMRYVVYPWRRTVVKLPAAEAYRRLRTTRNRYLIDDSEQRRWSRAVLGIAGLSVGSSALTVCALTGASRFRLADPDHLGLTNLNRLPASVCDIGVSKTVLACRRVLELDPYSSVTAFPRGYDDTTAATFLGTAPGAEPLTVLIEEMDDFAAKIEIRLRARAAGIPVLMATDNGDNVILDVERFDLDSDYPLFHGRAGEVTESLAAVSDPRERARIAQRIVGTEITPRTRYSLTEVGRSLTSWPQLGTAATLAGVAAAYAARLVACGSPLRSGRYRIDPDLALRGAAAAAATRWNEMDTAAFLAVMNPAATTRE
ncbi:ThiF family adenylyltransferase [Nocardia macrotermitis]|uniref:THIF-type NAD/FAD binding fold domain-containing protein n=1 Tax=Nocardia macrotermitis TaxID=2585198 RepID=A0A7K0D496_9NOCA|nr:ThiF family adenylyltransferase [Nocardia macrotermitis]MQY20142.1 hypothetical protein [Nocardia macrotermitis]